MEQKFGGTFEHSSFTMLPAYTLKYLEFWYTVYIAMILQSIL